ncbi:SDR family NAD(P)-dependent oxidoreductase [Alphaproteobacteria bacterium]|nr:SDR family NAD(P)-dependent oxidoreductase [Alphaproteobacteria bacterium]
MAAVVVTGGASPLGQELIQRFLLQGFDVISIVRPHHGIKETGKPTSRLRVIAADLSIADDINNVCEVIKTELPLIWSFVHAASSSESDSNNINKLCHTFTTNVFSGWVIAEACAKKMSDGGRIVYIGSVGHKFGGKADRVGYAASKYLLEYFPRHIRALAKENILINTVQVGVMDGATQKKTGITGDQLAKRQALIPIGRMASVHEIAETVMFLCSDSNTYIHGAVVPATGGE